MILLQIDNPGVFFLFFSAKCIFLLIADDKVLRINDQCMEGLTHDETVAVVSGADGKEAATFFLGATGRRMVLQMQRVKNRILFPVLTVL